MKIFQKISSIFGAKRYNDILKLGGEYTSDQLRTMSRKDYLDAYKGWVFRSVSTIASKTASLSFHLIDSRNQKQIDHEYLNLIKYDLLEAIAAFLKLNGSCYVWKNTIGGKVRALHVLRPDLVYPVYDGKWSRITGYKYRINGKELSFKAEEVLAFHNFNPLQAFPFVTQGVGDVQAAAIAIDTDHAASVWNWKFFENSARPGLFLESDRNLTEEVKKTLANAWNQKFRNVNNSHKLVILDGGLKANNVNPSQKEMDFVEGRRFSREEILGIFGVPKAVIGLAENVNVGNVKAFNAIFAEHTIQPLAIKIQEVLSEGLFGSIGVFEFINIIPHDDEETRKDFDSGFMTFNEIRATRGLPAIKGGDVLKSSPQTIAEPQAIPQKSGHSIFHKEISEIIRKNLKGTDEFNQERWKKRNERIAKFEPKMKEALLSIFNRQESDLLGQIKKSVKSETPKIDRTKYAPLYLSLLKPILVEMYDEEGQVAMQEVSADTQFRVGDPVVASLIKDEILRLGKGIDETTNQLIATTIANATDEGLGVSAVIERLKDVFMSLKEQRIETIVRTETVRASNQASVQSWTQSGVVKAKEWWTAQDERVSAFDKALHGKVISLESNFFKQGDTFEVDGQILKIDYTDIPAPPLHPNCRCTLLPIIK